MNSFDMQPLFQDRRDAGRTLAAALLTGSKTLRDPVVLALPRGGVPVAFEVADQLRAPLDVCIVQRLEVPGRAGVPMGAIGSGPVLVLLQSAIDEFQVPEKEIVRVARKQMLALIRRERAYRGERQALCLSDRTVILVDDGLTSSTVPAAAIAAIRARSPKRIVIAAPVACADTHRELRGLVDDLVCLEVPRPFHKVQNWYREFPTVSDLEVRRLHREAAGRARAWPYLH
jgi:putative phosphoribosyl transferase